MGHMGDGVPGPNFFNTAWICTKIWQHIDIHVYSLSLQWYIHDGLILSEILMDF